MLFNSYGFIFVFLPVVFAGFFCISRVGHKLAALWLAAASLFFYGWWNPRFVLLLLASIFANYAFGYLIGRSRGTARGKTLLVSALVSNLAVLAFFKYANFFLATVSGLGIEHLQPLDVVLPLGISFFTFTQIAFLVDVHRGLAREYNFIHYLLFVSYFPHLIAGPILHHKEIMPQFESPGTYRVRMDIVAVGVTMFTLGLAKKVLLADSFGEYATPLFDAANDGATPQFLVAWAGALAYTLQIYFDFSGYSDMAIGASLLFGVKLPLNFASPYKAHNIIEFWRRWHMTLSRFLRDYLYIPLGGNRRGTTRRYTNLLVTMLLGGLWHGASWTFLAWGGLHGLFLVVNHGWRRLRERVGVAPSNPSRVGTVLSVGITFLSVVMAWVLFRAAGFAAAKSILAGMMGFNGISLPRTVFSMLGGASDLLVGLGMTFEGSFAGGATLAGMSALPFAALLTVGLLIVWGLPNTQQFLGLAGDHARSGEPESALLRWRATPTFGVVIGILLAVSVLNLSKVSTFIYYQF